MLDFHQKRRLKSILSHPAIRVLLVLVLLLIAYSAFIRFEIASEMKERREAAEAEVSELREQKLRLEKEVEYLSNDRGIEAEMRRQFDIALPGEEVVVILEDQATTEPSELGDEEDQNVPWYQFWR